MSKWSLTFRPWPWQLDALKEWDIAFRGVVSVTTGAGKTFLALSVMHKIRQSYPDCRFLLIVPTVPLLDQWLSSLSNDLGIAEEEISVAGGGWKFSGPNIVNLMVAKTASAVAPSLLRAGKWCVIVDECHKIASPSYRKAIRGDHFAALGLSATPERDHDDWFAEHVVPALGNVIYEYPYEQAARDGVVVPFDIENVSVPLSNDEQVKIERLNRRIAVLLKQDAEGNQEALKRLRIARSGISKSAKARIPATIALAEAYRGKRGIVFHEYIEDAERLVALLESRGHRVKPYHSKLHHASRYMHLQMFRTGQIDSLVTCTALDEGLNVPDAEYAIIASATTARRQRIQRIGRILRVSKGKARAKISTLYCLPSERRFLQKEIEATKGVGQVRWLSARNP